MKKIVTGLVILALLLGYLFFWPVPVDPAAWQPPKAPTLTGRYARNDKLSHVTLLAKGVGVGPEDIVLDKQGRIYTGYQDGRVMRFNSDGSHPELIAETGGRPLGLALDADGRVIVADGKKGLLRIDKAGAIETLSTQSGDIPFGFPDNPAVADNGQIYFSDASTKFGPARQGRDDIIEHRGHGRLLRYDPDTGDTVTLLGGLQFANGVTMMPDQKSVLVAETGNYDIIRYWIKGPRAGQHEVFFRNLPGLPDNIASNGKDTIWVALFAPRNQALDAMGPHPFLRKLAFRLPQFLQPQPAPQAFVIGLSLDGKVTHNLQYLSNDSYHPVTGVRQSGNKLYLGSLTYPAMAVYDLGQNGSTTKNNDKQSPTEPAPR